ncbi:MAG: ACT domain-containing protein [Oscillospiraceae bacterium]|nr:ACT domain-containing protein [Oscillospiraceae bacterium]
MGRFLLVDASVLPEVFTKVIEVKKLLYTNKVKATADAVKQVGISRSSYYKYKDCVFQIDDALNSRKITISLIVKHIQGVLSGLLDTLTDLGVNIITINQSIPFNEMANITITMDISKITFNANEIITSLEKNDSIIKLDIISME